MLHCCQLLIDNKVECKVSFLIERGMFAIKACILNNQMRGALPCLANLFLEKSTSIMLVLKDT